MLFAKAPKTVCGLVSRQAAPREPSHPRWDPLLTWQMFPQNNQCLSSNLTYLTILQPLHALIADALAARARQRSPTFAQRAAGRAAAELMSAAITEWSRRGGRVKLARLVAEAVGAIQAELTTESDLRQGGVRAHYM